MANLKTQKCSKQESQYHNDSGWQNTCRASFLRVNSLEYLTQLRLQKSRRHISPAALVAGIVGSRESVKKSSRQVMGCYYVRT